MSDLETPEPGHQLVSVSVEDVELLQRHQRKANRPDDILQKASDHVRAIRSVYESSEDIVAMAYSQYNSFMSSDPAKKSTHDVAALATKVIAGLDFIQTIHPFVGVAVLAFKAVIKFEVDRRENDKRVTGLIYQGTDLMVTLLQLKDMPPDPKIAIPGQGPANGRLQSVLNNVHAKLEECGNTIDRYYKSKPIARFFLSSDWADQFKALATSFKELKADIANVLTINTAIQMVQASATIEKTFALLVSKTEQEKEFEIEVRRRGGAEACLNRISDLRELHAKYDFPGTSKNDKVKSLGITKTTGASRIDSKKDPALDATLLYDLRTPLHQLLEENKNIYGVMLEAQTNEIQDTIKKTEARLLHAFTSGAHRRVHDPHLRYIWRTMKWPLSVDTPYFIAAVYDYFADCFAQALTTREGSLAGDLSPRTPAIELSATNDVDDEPPPAVSLSDEWCLTFLDVYYVPALKEVFDDDANGLVNIREVNSFCDARHLPTDWGILRRLAYAAAGWHTEMNLYCTMIQSLLNQLVYLQDDVLPGNRRLVCKYLNSDAIQDVKLLTRGMSESPTGVDLTELVRAKMQMHEQQLEEKLDMIKYEIPSDEFVPLWFGKGRVEQYLLPLIFVLIRHHVEIVMFASGELIDQRELTTGTSTLTHVIDRALDRVDYLEESFQQQGVDLNARFKTFARGLYTYLWDPANAPDDFEFWDEHRQFPDDVGLTLSAIDQSKLLFEVPQREILAVQPEYRNDESHKNTMIEYIRLAKLVALDNLKFTDGPPYLPEDKIDEFWKLQDSLSADEQTYCDTIADLEFRESHVAVHSYGCNACERSPLLGTMYDCLDCGEGQYQLCSECVFKSTAEHAYPDDNHTLKHNMLRHTIEVSYDVAYRMRRGVIEDLRYYLMPLRLDPGMPAEKASEITSTTIPATFSEDSDQQLLDQDTALADNTQEQDDQKGMDQVSMKIASNLVSPQQLQAICTNCSSDLGSTFYCCDPCGEFDDDDMPDCYLCTNCADLTVFEKATRHNASHRLILIRDVKAPFMTRIPQRGQDSEPVVSSSERLEQQVEMLQTRVGFLEGNVSKMLKLLEGIARDVQTA